MKTVALLIFLAVSAVAKALDLAAITFTNRRWEVEQSLTNRVFYKGQTILLTNCVLLADDTPTNRQSLAGLTLTAYIGESSELASGPGMIADTNNGVWWARVTIPLAMRQGWATVQIKLTDAATNTFIYPHKYIPVIAPLQ